MNNIQLKNTFTNVRQAYRLLFQYQKRVLDLVKFIGDSYGFGYKSGWPKFSEASPQPGKGSLDSWAWDWLNMYYYEFHFGINLVEKQKIVFSIILESDTGYKDRPNIKTSATDVENFYPPETSKTVLHFIACNQTEKWNGEELQKVLDIPSEDYEGPLLHKAYDLTEFVDEISTRNKIIEFNTFCETQGLSMAYAHKKQNITHIL